MTEQELQKQKDHEEDLIRLRGFRPADDTFMRVDLMCKAMDELREQSIQRGIDQNRVESIKNTMEGLKYTAQQAMDLLKIPVSDQPKYLSKL